MDPRNFLKGVIVMMFAASIQSARAPTPREQNHMVKYGMADTNPFCYIYYSD